MEIIKRLQPRRLAKAPRALSHFFTFTLIAEAREGSAKALRSQRFLNPVVAKACEGSAKAQHIRLASFSLIAKACGRFREGSAEASSDNYFVQLPSWTSPAPLGLPQCYI